MKKIIIFGVIGAFLVGCASTNQPKPNVPKPKQKTNDKNLKVIQAFVKTDKNNSKNINIIAKYSDKITDSKEAKKILLKTNPLFAKKYKKEALKEKVPLAPNAPLYIPPRFAKMIVFPYVSNDGIYHDTQVVWIKVKDGQFVVLNQKTKNTKVRVFNPLRSY